MTKIAVLDDWQDVAQAARTGRRYRRTPKSVFFAQAFDDEDDAAAQLADFEDRPVDARSASAAGSSMPPAHAANAWA